MYHSSVPDYGSFWICTFQPLPTSNTFWSSLIVWTRNLMFNLCIYPLEKSQEADIFFPLHCSRLLITLLNGSYLKDDDCLLCWGQLSNLPQGAEKMQVASLADPSPCLPQGAKLVHSVPCSPEAGAALMMVWPAEISQYALSSVLLEWVSLWSGISRHFIRSCWSRRRANKLEKPMSVSARCSKVFLSFSLLTTDPPSPQGLETSQLPVILMSVYAVSPRPATPCPWTKTAHSL